jgi:hypothetical protein
MTPIHYDSKNCHVIETVHGIYWFLNGAPYFHREDGPAVIESNGNKEWWLFGKKYGEEDYNQMIEMKAFW